MGNGTVIAHHSPGRIRVKSRKLRGNPRLGKLLEDKLSAVPGVNQVKGNSTTGSVVLRYDASHPEATSRLEDTLREINKVLEAELPELGVVEEWLEPEVSLLKDIPLVREMTNALERADVELRTGTGGQFDLATLLPLALGGVLFAVNEHARTNPLLIGGLALVSAHSYLRLHRRPV